MSRNPNRKQRWQALSTDEKRQVMKALLYKPPSETANDDLEHRISESSADYERNMVRRAMMDRLTGDD